MIHNGVNIWWENGLCVVVDWNSRICPPKEGLRQRSSIIKLTLNLDVCLSRIYTNAHQSFCSIHLIHIVAQHRCATIFIFLNLIINWKEGSRAVMLRPVKLNTTRDPRAGQADKCRFDDVIVIDKIITVCLVVGTLDSSAKFWKNHDFNIFILQPNCCVLFVLLFIADFFNCRIRVYLSTAALIYTLL